VRMIEDIMDTQFEAITWRLGKLNFFKRAEGFLKSHMESQARSQANAFLARLETHLGDANRFNDAQFGWGDLSVVPHLNGAAGFGIGPRPRSSRVGSSGPTGVQAWRRPAGNPRIRSLGWRKWIKP